MIAKELSRRINEDLEKNMSISDIASKHGISEARVYLEKENLTASERNKKISDEYAKGASVPHLALKYRLRQITIQKILSMERTEKMSHGTTEKVEKALALHESMWSNRDIAKEVGMSPTWVRNEIEKDRKQKMKERLFNEEYIHISQEEIEIFKNSLKPGDCLEVIRKLKNQKGKEITAREINFAFVIFLGETSAETTAGIFSYEELIYSYLLLVARPKVVSLLEEGVPVREISGRTGIDLAFVRKIARKYMPEEAKEEDVDITMTKVIAFAEGVNIGDTFKIKKEYEDWDLFGNIVKTTKVVLATVKEKSRFVVNTSEGCLQWAELYKNHCLYPQK